MGTDSTTVGSVHGDDYDGDSVDDHVEGNLGGHGRVSNGETRQNMPLMSIYFFLFFTK